MIEDVPTVFLVATGRIVPGSLGEPAGAVTFVDAGPAGYGVPHEIARPGRLAGGRVPAVRRHDVPDSGPVAAILRRAPNLS
jgi:hypothetical protein